MDEKRKAEKEELEKRKMEIAKELGFAQKIEQGGYGALTCKEAGMIGARIGNRIDRPKSK